MTSVGQILRSARERQGREIAEIAEELCITQRYVRALERDDLSNLPGTFFYKSFVKQYAGALGVQLKEIQPGIDALTNPAVQPADQHAAPPTSPLTASINIPLETSHNPAPIRVLDPLVEASNRYFSNRKIGMPIALLAVVLLACSGFYSWWTQPPRVRARSAAPAATASTAATIAPAVNISTGQDADAVNHVVLNLSATEKTWLSITNSEGKQIFSGLLEPSQTKTLTASDAAQMLVGNAGGLEVRLNGKEVGPLGGRGQVRTVRFRAPDKVEIVEPTPPPPPVDTTL